MVSERRKQEVARIKLRHFPRILLAAPIHDSKSYIAKEYFENVLKLEYPKLDCIFADNSETDKFANYVSNNLGYEVIRRIRYNTKRNPIDRQCSSLNQIRDHFLKEDYDYLFLLESDLIPNSDIIEHLLHHQKDAVSAVYLLDKNKGITCITTKTFIATNGGFSNVFVKPGWIDGELKEVIEGCGLGCTLIHRKVLEKIKFRCGSVHADTYFWQDVRQEGFKTYIDTSMVVRHYPSNDPNIKNVT